MPINYNPASLAGLSREGRAPLDYAGQELIVAAIAESLAEEVQTDDEIRHYLCKVDDFEVTEAVRDEVLRRRALVVYRSIFEGIKNALIKGEEVSINGFARFFVSGPDDSVEVGVIIGGGSMAPILPDSVITYENRTAALVAGCWQGAAVPLEHDTGDVYPLGTTDVYDAVHAVWVPLVQSAMFVDGAAYELKNQAVVTAAGEDGQTREYFVGGLSIKLEVSRRVETRWNDGHGALAGADEYTVYTQLAGQRARVWSAQGFAGEPLEVAEKLGRSVAMSVDDWELISGRRVSVLPPIEVAREAFYGIPAHNILEAYPRRVKVMRHNLATWDVRKISPEEYKAVFLHREAELTAAGVWPRRVRNTEPSIKAEFRAAFVEGVQ